jgi:RNA polymerase sigma factor (sigma-70 family)
MSQSERPKNSDMLSDEELNRLFETYLPKLIRLADHRISTRVQAKFGADDVAATVCRSVFRRFKDGKFRFDDDAEFWRLLVTVTKRKISNKVRHFSTQSRSVADELSETASFILATPEPGPSEAIAFEESLQTVADSLEPQERNALLLRMDGWEHHEIAERLNVSERTIRRKMEVIKLRLNEVFWPADDMT